MSLEDIANSLATTWLAETLTDSTWLFGVVEAVHVMALTLVFGSIALVDLRLIGLAQRHRDADTLVRQLLPLTWGGFALAAISGTTMIFANPHGYFDNTFFRAKMVALVLAGLNVLLFHYVVQPRAHAADAPKSSNTLGQRLSGGISLLLWLTIITCGRWIGFTI
ncbi:DUF6644 family protein [Novosphingobium sp.]|uniref:DUF6644 family protein n=1 Tax=Novosphingobium sp. TaxID=1874826 RepID=UPI00334092DF